MKRLLASVVLGLFAFGGALPRAVCADPPAITSAVFGPSIRSQVIISKAIDPSRFIHPVADDQHAITKSTTAGLTEFDESVKSFVEDPGGPTILLDDETHGFDPSLPADGMIGKFSGTSIVSQHTTVTATSDTVDVHSSADIACSKTRIPNNALMGAFPNGVASVGVNIQIARPCRYSLSATVSADPDDPVLGHGQASVTIGGNDPQGIPDGTRQVFIETKDPHPPSTVSLHLAGVFQPGGVQLTISAGLLQSGPEGRASWNVTLVLSPDGPSDDIRWTKSSGGGFGNTANWLPPQVPLKDSTHTDNAIFGLGRAYTVDFAVTKASAPRTSDRLLVERGHVTFENANYKVDDTSLAQPSLVVDVGTLTLASGNLTSNSANIGDIHSVGAEVEVTGQGSHWDCLGRLRVGGSSGGSGAAGKLTITDGASVTSAESLVGADAQEGDATVDGTGSQWTTGNISVGFSSPGFVEVKGGAHVSSGRTDVGSAGLSTILVSGADAGGTPSQWAGTDLLYVGPVFAVVAVEKSARMTVAGTYVDGGVVAVANDPAGSTTASFFAGGDLLLFDDGKFQVTDGAHASLGTCGVGLAGPGALVVSGTDAATNAPSTFDAAGSISVGEQDGGAGRMTVSGGAKATCHDDVEVATHGKCAGTAALGGASTWNIDGDLHIGGEGTGVFVIDSAVLTIAKDVFLNANGSLRGSGTVVIGGCFRAAAGTIEPGVQLVGAVPLPVTKRSAPSRRKKPVAPPGGTLTIQGNLEVGPAGVVRAEAAGPQSDRLVVTGDATLEGTLVLQFRNGFAPKTGDQFEVMHVNGAVTGGFATVETRGLAPGAQFDFSTTAGALKATAMNDAVALPTVSVSASPKKLLEKKAKKKGALTFTRKGDVSAPLTIAYTVGGTAENGVDCVQLLGSVTFPAKKKSVKVPVAVANDRFREGTETLEVTVVSGADYTHSVASAARIAIVDNPPSR